MAGGRIAHSRFKISIKLAYNSICNFTKQSGTAALLREASLIIWDEVAMTRRQAVETLDRSLQDVTGISLESLNRLVARSWFLEAILDRFYLLYIGGLEHRSRMRHCYGLIYGIVSKS